MAWPSTLPRLRAIGVTPHVAQNTSRRTLGHDGHATQHASYGISQRLRKRIEQPFGWIKTAIGRRETHHRGCPGSSGLSPNSGGLQPGAPAQDTGEHSARHSLQLWQFTSLAIGKSSLASRKTEFLNRLETDCGYSVSEG
jgi:hypothetical protein